MRTGDCRKVEGGAPRWPLLRLSWVGESWRVAWLLRLVEIGAEGEVQAQDVMEIDRPGGLGDIATLGLTLSESTRLLAGLQQAIVAAQVRNHAVRRPPCSRCGHTCRVKDYREHRVATLFGQVTVRLARFRCAVCGGIEAGVDWPSYCRATPELVRLQAHLCALMSYRTAADLLEQLFPVNAVKHSETVRRHALKVGKALQECPVIAPETMAPVIVVTLDSTFIRSCEKGERHLEVRVGNVETKSGGRQVFGAVAKAETDIKALINRNLEAVRRTAETALTAFTDGCSGLRRILAGVTNLPFLDWFHIGMRLQHLKQVAGALSGDDPSREAAKAVIVGEVERLHWRLWNGKATNARISIDRIHVVMQHFKGELGTGKSIAASRKLWTALHAIDSYLTGQSDWLVNYAERHRAGCGLAPRSSKGQPTFSSTGG
jgi:hypothetical protein